MDRLRTPVTLTITLGFCLALLLLGCSSKSAVYELSGSTMGTYYSVKLWGVYSEAQLEELRGAIELRLRSLNQTFSTYDPTSEISVLNGMPANEPITVSDEFDYVLNLARDVSRGSAGAFDPTVAPLVDLWGFGAKGRRDVPPTATQIQMAVNRVGLDNFQSDQIDGKHQITKVRDDARLDFSAIAKGYAVDAISMLLMQRHVDNHLVDIGGEVVGRGSKGGESWRVAIEQPTSHERSARRVLELRNQAIATSGDYRNYFEYEGKHYSHAIDPRNGYPVTTGVVSATVLAPRCDVADAWATAFMVMTDQERESAINTLNLSVYLIILSEKGRYTEYKTGYFKE